MSIKDKLARVVGLSGARDAQPPRYRAIAPGLVVTETAAWAWFEIPPTNSDLLSEHDRDNEQDRAGNALRALRGRECHLRTVWGRVSGDEYLAGLPLDGATDLQQEWASLRADSIDDLAVPTRRTLLGVKISDRRSPGTGEAFGLTSGAVPAAELDRLTASAVRIGQELRATVWRVRLAATETMAWVIARELHRESAIPAEDSISGAPLARLTTGRVQPAYDHLLILDHRGRPAAFAAVLALTDFPEVIESPGQEWIACLNHLVTNPTADVTDADGESVAVLAESSVRFTVPTSRSATKTVNDVHASAKEQRKSAARHSAGEPDDEILLAEAETAELKLRLARGHTLLVHDHPRVIVQAGSRAALDAKVTAVRAAYDDMGITGAVMIDEQREAWLETLPCDQVRVDDLGHWRDAAAFTTSWFWGGSRVGTTRSDVPAIGYSTGSTQNLVRFLATESVEGGDAPVTVMLGRTRRGKTVAMMLAMLDVALWPGHREMPWACLIDLKGDAGGVVDVGRRFGVPADLLTVDQHHAGIFDAFRTSPREHAVDHTVSQLSLLIPERLAVDGQAVMQRTASNILLNDPDPWCWKVVESIVKVGQISVAGSLMHELAETLSAATRSGFGRLIAGQPGPNPTELRVTPGISVVSLPGLTLPEPDDPPTTWQAPQRSSVAALRGVLGWCTTVSASMEFRHRPKVVGVPEVHLLTATVDGRTFLTRTARMGAAFGLSLLLDTQDVTGIASMTGLNEAISAVFGFAQQTNSEQDALAHLLGLPVGEATRDVIDELDRPTSDELTRHERDAYEPRRGHCLYRDQRGDVATLQWVVPNAEIAAMLDTSARATHERYLTARQLALAEHDVVQDADTAASGGSTPHQDAPSSAQEARI